MWSTRDADWEEGFGQLRAYVQAEGTARVSQSYRTGDGYRLGVWVNKQRRTKDSIPADRVQRLERLKGWVWDARDYDAASASASADAPFRPVSNNCLTPS